MNDEEQYKHLGVEECDPLSVSYLEVFERNIKNLYNKENPVSKVVYNYVSQFIKLFKDADAMDKEFLNPLYKAIFTFDFPKLSALFSLSVHIYMTGGLKATDTSPVCHTIYILLFIYLSTIIYRNI
jgi:hypothetical protein